MHRHCRGFVCAWTRLQNCIWWGDGSGKFKKYAVKIGSDLDAKIHVIQSLLLIVMVWIKKATEVFIRWVKNTIPMLFTYTIFMVITLTLKFYSVI